MNSDNDSFHKPHLIQQKPKISSWVISTIIFVILLIIGLFASTLNTTKDNQPILTKASPEHDTNLVNSRYQTPTSVLTQISIPQPKPGFEQRISGTFKYGYAYPIPNTLPLRVENLWPYDGVSLLQPDPKAGLLKKDLYCNADGPHGSQRCQNTKVEDFTNSLGFKGFKVYRTRTQVYRIKPTDGEVCETCYDLAYVFPLQEKINDYDGVLFYLDSLTQPTQVELSALEEVANSFFSF